MDSADEEFNPSSARAAPVARPSRQKKNSKGGTKLKVNLGSQRSAGGFGKGDGWDRELDSDPDEPLAIEEQFILRVPKSLVPKMKTMVESRNVTSDLWIKFKDSRRGTFHFGEKLYGTKLVDLPTLVESQKHTGVGGHYVKVADISQMLVVGSEIKDENGKEKEKVFNIDDFIWPDGISPPLKHVKKRRFRRRVNRRTIEVVENAVEKLLEEDAKADDVQYDLLDHDPDEESDYGSPGPASTSKLPQDDDMDSIGGRTPAGEQFGGDDGDEDEEGGSGFDSDLADEINKGLEAQNNLISEKEKSGSEEEDGDGLFGASSSEEEEEEETFTPEELEQKRRMKLLLEEIGDLERAIGSKQVELGKAMNLIFKKRFEDTIKKLSTERDAKKAQHATAIKAIETKKVNAEKRVEEDKAAKEQLEKDKIDSQMPDALEPVIVQNDAMDIES